MTTIRRPIAFAAALIAALLIFFAHLAARPAEAAPHSAAPTPVAVPTAPAPVFAQTPAPAEQPAIVAAAPVPTPKVNASSVSSVTASAANLPSPSPSFVVGLSSFVVLLAALAALGLRRPASSRRPICA
jgi:hypothetical protein